MHIQAKIQKWGNGLGLRVSGVLRDVPEFKEGAQVDIEILQDGFIVKKKTKQKSSQYLLPYTEEQILKNLTSDGVDSELLPPLLSSERYD